jgi:hypothetical protein
MVAQQALHMVRRSLVCVDRIDACSCVRPDTGAHFDARADILWLQLLLFVSVMAVSNDLRDQS